MHAPGLLDTPLTAIPSRKLGNGNSIHRLCSLACRHTQTERERWICTRQICQPTTKMAPLPRIPAPFFFFPPPFMPGKVSAARNGNIGVKDAVSHPLKSSSPPATLVVLPVPRVKSGSRLGKSRRRLLFQNFEASSLSECITFPGMWRASN